MGLKESRKKAEIFFENKKIYNKTNRNKTFEQLDKMGIQEQLMEFIGKLISERWFKLKLG